MRVSDDKEQREKRQEKRVELRCVRGCGKTLWGKAGSIDITTSGHTDQRCACGGTMVVES